MIEVKNIKTFNIARAVYSARNALNSWDKSDSDLDNDVLGEADMALAKKLINGGSEHRKFLRQIFVTMDITAPIYWWKEFDTYKVGTTANSTSTMHTLHKRDLVLDDFSYEQMTPNAVEFLGDLIHEINSCRRYYIDYEGYVMIREEKGLTPIDRKTFWYSMIQLLPSSLNQTRTVTVNYENVLNIIRQRRKHKLDEWKKICEILLKELPYMSEFMEKYNA